MGEEEGKARGRFALCEGGSGGVSKGRCCMRQGGTGGGRNKRRSMRVSPFSVGGDVTELTNDDSGEVSG
jgi:hypothetical protein